MPEKLLDCQSLPCPGPVLQTKTYIEAHNPGQLTVLVDNEAAQENVSRFLHSKGYVVEPSLANGVWRLYAYKSSSSTSYVPPTLDPTPPQSSSLNIGDQEKCLVLITGPVIGKGDDELGQKLMKNFLLTLPEMEGSLWRIILLNGGVTLASQGSFALEALQGIEQSGVSILVCGTCLEHFGLLKSKSVGQTTNMLDVVTSMQHATKVIQL